MYCNAGMHMFAQYTARWAGHFVLLKRLITIFFHRFDTVLRPNHMYTILVSGFMTQLVSLNAYSAKKP